MLQKKRSNAGAGGVRGASQPIPLSRGVQTTTITAAGQNSNSNNNNGNHRGGGGGGGVRKGSLRNAVRKLFGRQRRSSKEIPSSSSSPFRHTTTTSPPRHGYHASEPLNLTPHPEERSAPTTTAAVIPHRTLSAPLHQQQQPLLPRTRSPYAVEFPQSSRLKPLDLGNPFTAPGSSLRRRKTLPEGRDTPEEEEEDGVGTAVLVNPKRRSRSAGDLKAVMGQRKRSEEIRFWRESVSPPPPPPPAPLPVGGAVLRASGFVVSQDRPPLSVHLGEQVDEEEGGFSDERTDEEQQHTPVAPARTFDPFDLGVVGAASSSSRARVGSIGTEDLEERVARLEAHLQRFQHMLSRLTAERHRRTVLVGGQRTRTSADGGGGAGGRTPSMLADTLSGFGPSGAEVEAGWKRPETSPKTPPPRPQRPRDVSPPLLPAMAPLLPPEMTDHRQRLPEYTFRSLYEMLSDERSARRRLESELRNLRREIRELHFRVESSERGSFGGGSGGGGVGGSGEGEGGAFASSVLRHGVGGVVSRFSGSESAGAGGEEGEGQEEPEYEGFQTPGEEMVFGFGGGGSGGARREDDRDMF